MRIQKVELIWWILRIAYLFYDVLIHKKVSWHIWKRLITEVIKKKKTKNMMYFSESIKNKQKRRL